MSTFAERLKKALEQKGISQAEAARLCGISQQSINYIINNNLQSSKLATQIASGLGINPEWIIYGKGRFEETKVFELPLIHSPYMLKKFLNHTLDLNYVDYVLVEVYLGESAFAYLLNSKEMILCHQVLECESQLVQYLTLCGDLISITEEKSCNSFTIFERRIRYVDFK